MAKNIWQDSTKSIPKSNSQVARVDFNKSDLGARTSHLNKIYAKSRSDGSSNGYSIKHTKG